MSWLGKILTFLVLVAACVWVFFTVQAYATRTNWKVRADAYEKAFKESEEARQKEYRDNQATRDALARVNAAERSRADDLEKSLADVSSAGKKADAEYKKLEQDYMNADVQARILIAGQKTILDELTATRARNTALEDERQKLVLATEAANRARLSAENESRLARSIADENARKVERLTALVTELRQTGGGGGTATVLRTIDKTPPPPPEGVRGTITQDMVGNFVAINIGIDAGLEQGSRLDVYRETEGGKYLGTLVITKSIYPKEAVAEFRPARRVSIAQLRPDELPRKGDLVGQVSSGHGPR
ncbi:hypothetical protein [Frigoriglobus tundricola]|uniref:Uncharacterized protein n=1 Tax=Frigoriglobus tundricola TaxID=2774151 RepID=A0A6M5YQF9_9BACT|nr:hypothetical protein [Frigoriglobus tundricola]QJW96269.1 hypothetical protein FTUN_3826 [Frigoriglobus tundricola]